VATVDAHAVREATAQSPSEIDAMPIAYHPAHARRQGLPRDRDHTRALLRFNRGMDWHARIATLASWQATDDDERGEVLTAAAAALGDGWSPGRRRVGRAGLGELCHATHGGFVVVPGGWLRMGFSVDDLYAGARARDDGAPTPSGGGVPLASRPTRWVRMRPYLLAIAGMPPEGEAPASDGGAKSAAYRDAVEAQRRREADDDAPHRRR
jgi:hypothetical protein